MKLEAEITFLLRIEQEMKQEVELEQEEMNEQINIQEELEEAIAEEGLDYKLQIIDLQAMVFRMQRQIEKQSYIISSLRNYIM
jgi:hypothetical protein